MPQGCPSPGFVEQILEPAGDMMAAHAGPARLDGAGDFGDGAEVQFANLAANIGFGERKAFADHSAFVLLVGVDVDAQPRQIHTPFLRPVEHGRLQGLGPHHRAVNLLRRQSFQKIDNVLVADLQGLDGRVTALFDQRTQSLRRGNRRRAAEGQIAGLRNHVLRRVGGVPLHSKREPHDVAAGDRTVLAEAIRILNLSHVRAGLAVNGIHEQLLRLIAVLPSHTGPPTRSRRKKASFYNPMCRGSSACCFDRPALTFGTGFHWATAAL